MLGNDNVIFSVQVYLLSYFCLLDTCNYGWSGVGKIGYGTVSEALAYKLPFVFVRRDYFNEEPFLRNMLEVETFQSLTCVVIQVHCLTCYPSLFFNAITALSMWHWDDTEGFTYWTLETLPVTCDNTSALLWWPHKRWWGSPYCSQTQAFEFYLAT
jgi:hypothetical protein